MSQGATIGISKTMFIVGLVIAIFASSLLATSIVMQLGVQGPQGETGIGFEPVGYVSVPAAAFAPQYSNVSMMNVK
jgi:hypothetical protein